MSCKRLDIMEFHCHEGRHLRKYTLLDWTIDLLTFLATLPFITPYDIIIVAVMVLQMPTKIAVFLGKKIIFHKSLDALQFD